MSGDQKNEADLKNTYQMQKATLRAKEAAEYLGISYWLLLEMVKRKEIPVILAGNRKLFRRNTLNLWLENQEAASVR